MGVKTGEEFLSPAGQRAGDAAYGLEGIQCEPAVLPPFEQLGQGRIGVEAMRQAARSRPR